MIRCIQCDKPMTAQSDRKRYCSTKCRNSHRYGHAPVRTDPLEPPNKRKQWDCSELAKVMK